MELDIFAGIVHLLSILSWSK